MYQKSLTFALFAALMLSSSIAGADPPTSTVPAVARSIFRFDFTVHGIDENPHAVPATYTLFLAENQSGSVSTGTNVPLVVTSTSAGPTSSARQDIGLNLHFSFVIQGAVLVLTGSTEMSSVDPAGTNGLAAIHRMHADGVVPVTPGRPTLVSSVSDLSTHRRYEIMVARDAARAARLTRTCSSWDC